MDATEDKDLLLDQLVDIPDYMVLRDSFCEVFKQATEGRKTSLPFIRNTLPSKPLVGIGGIFQVFVIGGTNCETATVRYNDDGTISVIDFQAYRDFYKFKSTHDLFNFVDEHVDEIIEAIGINFAFSLKPVSGSLGQLDGVLINGETKGHLFEGLQQKEVGSVIAKHLEERFHRKYIVSVANDVVCLIAAIVNRDIDRSSLIAGIVGTGVNMAFFADEHTIINAELADFDGFTQTATGKLVDAASPNPGKELYEKEVAAGNLFQHYNMLVDPLGLSNGKLESTKAMALIAESNEAIEGKAARKLIHRSASMFAAQLAGYYCFRQKPHSITAIMQGGLYWEGPAYKDIVVEQLIKLEVPADVFMFEIMERSSLIGAAKLITGGF